MAFINSVMKSVLFTLYALLVITVNWIDQGCGNVSVLTVLRAVFGFDRNFFRFWVIFSIVLRFPIGLNASLVMIRVYLKNFRLKIWELKHRTSSTPIYDSGICAASRSI